MKTKQLFNAAPTYESPRVECTQIKTRRVLCGSPLEANSADPGWNINDPDNEDVNSYGDL